MPSTTVDLTEDALEELLVVANGPEVRRGGALLSVKPDTLVAVVVEVLRRRKCPLCEGDGELGGEIGGDYDNSYTCPGCGGDGKALDAERLQALIGRYDRVEGDAMVAGRELEEARVEIVRLKKESETVVLPEELQARAILAEEENKRLRTELRDAWEQTGAATTEKEEYQHTRDNLADDVEKQQRDIEALEKIAEISSRFLKMACAPTRYVDGIFDEAAMSFSLRDGGKYWLLEDGIIGVGDTMVEAHADVDRRMELRAKAMVVGTGENSTDAPASGSGPT